MIKVVFTNFITRNELRLNKWDYTIYFSTIDSSLVICHYICFPLKGWFSPCCSWIKVATEEDTVP